ncbi:MAG: DUF1461 domain-containing protein [Nanoarchaeota archaeon]|nr:DUF1461 domain-containing protein [Nanoarchaeota archaeon]
MKYALNRKLAVILCCGAISLFLLLLSYKTVLVFTDLTPAQEKVFDFLEEQQELPPEYTESEISHLEDVKKVMKYADYVFFVLLLTVTVIISYHRKNTDLVVRLLKYGGKITVVVIAIFGILSVFFFDPVFTLFHSLFFPQGNWTFAPDSVIIQTFPLDFFMSISRNIFLLTLFLGILFILSEYFYNYVLRHRN